MYQAQEILIQVLVIYTLVVERSIRTILVPEDIVVQGIMYRKKDPVALVMIKGVKGLNKLKINSPVGP
jgi:hypothetical protein